MNEDGEMTRHNRSPLPIGEGDRLETLNEKILQALRDGPRTNKLLSRIALDYGRRIRDLRKEGHNIHDDRMQGGLHRYTLLERPDPKWLVGVRVTLADGREFQQKVIVHADRIGLAKNRAQHLATKIKVLGARQLLTRS